MIAGNAADFANYCAGGLDSIWQYLALINPAMCDTSLVPRSKLSYEAHQEST